MEKNDLLVFIADATEGVIVNGDYHRESNYIHNIIEIKDIEKMRYINDNETILNINMVNGDKYTIEML